MDDKAKEFLSKAKGNFKKINLPKIKNDQSRNRVLSYSGGSGINKKEKKSGNNQLDFLKKFQKGKNRGKKSSKRILNYANRAQASAEISKNKSRSIFNIISYRYRVSGLKALHQD